MVKPWFVTEWEYHTTRRERELIFYFDTPERPVSIWEAMDFLNSLWIWEKQALLREFDAMKAEWRKQFLKDKN